ncbi:helix-turn-helix transcriptional regulator [Candidatus Uhrbacteria bacterium]|nr:helix-turn-helix transcriptional regulator [Candidatus Uhrbacteria bacterium]
MKSFTTLKKKWLKDPAVRKEFGKLAPEFALIEMIIEKRIAKGFTQAQLAKKIGTQQSAIARLESGNYNPSIGLLQKVAGALNAKLNVSLS